MSWIMIVFPIGHLAVGIGLTYATLAGFLNSTAVEVGQGELSVRHFPLPWGGNRTLAAGQIVQLHCEQKLSNKNQNSSNIVYNLYATLNGGTRLQLLSGFSDVAEPRLIEQLIEERLQIQNRAVVGEYRG